MIVVVAVVLMVAIVAAAVTVVVLRVAAWFVEAFWQNIGYGSYGGCESAVLRLVHRV